MLINIYIYIHIEWQWNLHDTNQNYTAQGAKVRLDCLDLNTDGKVGQDHTCLLFLGSSGREVHVHNLTSTRDIWLQHFTICAFGQVKLNLEVKKWSCVTAVMNDSSTSIEIHRNMIIWLKLKHEYINLYYITVEYSTIYYNKVRHSTSILHVIFFTTSPTVQSIHLISVTNIHT